MDEEPLRSLDQPPPIGRRRLAGAAAALFGVLGTADEWHRMLTHTAYHPMVTLITPMIVVVGLGLLACPDYVEPQPKGTNAARLLQPVKPRWWLILALAFAAGVINRILIETM